MKNEFIYDKINQIIFEKLEQGVIPWKASWYINHEPAKNLITKKDYQGINSFILNLAGFNSPYFLTYRQAIDLGGAVNKGEKGIPVVFWKIIEKEENNKNKKIPLLRYYTVFNVEQCNDLDDKVPVTTSFERPLNPIKKAEKIVNNMPDKPIIRHQGNRAYYQPINDLVNIPDKNSFYSDEEYFCTIYHELAHATGSSSRLNRDVFKNTMFHNRHEYSKEELIAEFTASYLCAHAGIEMTTIDSSASYINGWLKVLNDQKNWLIIAASQAQKAADYVLNRQ